MTRMDPHASVTVRPPRRASARVRARHEAGHCVVAIATGWRPKRLSVLDASDCDGEIDYHPRRPRPPYDPEHRWRRLAVLFAGVEAERLVSHGSVFASLTEAGAGDLERVSAILDESYGPWDSAPEPFVQLRAAEEKRARRRARAILRAHWAAVQSLTSVLVAEGHLSGAAAFRIATAAHADLLRAFQRARRDARPSW